MQTKRWQPLLAICLATGLLTACTAMQNYLSGRTFSGEPLLRSGLLVIENLGEEAIIQIWARDDNLSDWRRIAGLSTLLAVPIVKPGESYEFPLVEGINDVKLIRSGGSEITKRVYMTPAGVRWTLEPERKPARVASAPPASPPPEPGPVTTSGTAASAPDEKEAAVSSVPVGSLEGVYATAKETNPHYGNQTWKTLEFEPNGTATWTWMLDFRNSSLRRPDDTCFWSAHKFQMSYAKKDGNTLELRCLDRKELFCTGRVKQRGCFSQSVPVRITAEGLHVDNGDNDGVYTRQ